MERTKSPSPEQTIHKELFSSDAYLTVNKRLLKKYGPLGALFIGYLVDKYRWAESKDALEGGRFFTTHSQITDAVGITDFQIRTLKKKFIDENIINIIRKGTPYKEWYLLDFSLLTSTVFQTFKNQRSRPLKIKGQEVEKTKPYITINSNNNKNKDSNNRKKQRNIIPPRLKWIQEYCQTRKNKIIPKQFYDHYQARGWKIGNNDMKDWQACVRTWEHYDKKFEKEKAPTNGSRVNGTPGMKYVEYDVELN